MTTIPDFTSAEHDLVAATLRQRLGRSVTLELGDTELQLDPDAAIATSCTTLYWQARGVDFVVCKVGPPSDRARFFGEEAEAAGRGVDDMSDLAGCIVTLLRLQSDYERRRASGRGPGLTRAAPQARQ